MTNNLQRGLNKLKKATSEHEEGERIIVAMNVMKDKFIETPFNGKIS